MHVLTHTSLRTDHTYVLRPLAHTPAFCRYRIRLRSWSFSHVPVLPLPVASTVHVYVASLILNVAQVRRARRANSNAVTLKLKSRPPARRPACRVQVRHASLPDRQLGGACADRLCVNTPIYLHCIQPRSRTLLRFCRCVCKRPYAWRGPSSCHVSSPTTPRKFELHTNPPHQQNPYFCCCNPNTIRQARK
jgi:hypothetical protein